MSPQTIIFIGRSGCGKGTQSKFIESYLQTKDPKHSIYYVETGANFREFIKGESLSSKLSKEIYSRNERQPDFLAIWTWSHLLVEQLTGTEHVLVDGTPRSLLEATVLNNALHFYSRKANVVYLNVSREWSEKKLLARGRSDDSSLAKIDKIMTWFDRDVVPAIEYFRNSPDHNFIEVDGEQGMEKVHENIVAQLKLS